MQRVGCAPINHWNHIWAWNFKKRNYMPNIDTNTGQFADATILTEETVDGDWNRCKATQSLLSRSAKAGLKVQWCLKQANTAVSKDLSNRRGWKLDQSKLFFLDWERWAQEQTLSISAINNGIGVEVLHIQLCAGAARWFFNYTDFECKLSSDTRIWKNISMNWHPHVSVQLIIRGEPGVVQHILLLRFL